MEKIKCITFDKEAQDALPQEIKDKMKADREKAREEFKESMYKDFRIMIDDIFWIQGTSCSSREAICKIVEEELESYTEWLSHRDLRDDFHTPKDWVAIYLNSKEKENEGD